MKEAVARRKLSVGTRNTYILYLITSSFHPYDDMRVGKNLFLKTREFFKERVISVNKSLFYEKEHVFGYMHPRTRENIPFF